jgi:hypothetical protein
MINIFIIKIKISYIECDKMKKSTQYTISIIAGLLLLAFGILYNIHDQTSKIISLIFITAGIMAIVVGAIKFNHVGKGLTHDERTARLNARAISYSWLVTFAAVTLLYWIDHFKLVNLSLSQVLGILFFTMILSSGVLQWTFQRKGVLNED